MFCEKFCLPQQLVTSKFSNDNNESEIVFSGCCVPIAVFECSLEDILDKKAAEAKGTVWKNS